MLFLNSIDKWRSLCVLAQVIPFPIARGISVLNLYLSFPCVSLQSHCIHVDSYSSITYFQTLYQWYHSVQQLTGHLRCAKHCCEHCTYLKSVYSHNNSVMWVLFLSHFTKKETKVQSLICPKFHNDKWESNLVPKPEFFSP